MSTKKRFTQEQFQKALAVPLVPFLEGRGYSLKRVGKEYHMRDHDSFVVSKNLWCWNSRNMGGNVISFLTKVENMTVVDAVLLLSGEDVQSQKGNIPTIQMPKKQRMELILPTAYKDSRRVFAYLLNSRGIDKSIIFAMMKEGNIYESFEFFANVNTNNGEFSKVKLVESSSFAKLQNNGMISDTQININSIVIGLSHNGIAKYAEVPTFDEATLSSLIKGGTIRDVRRIHNCVFVGRDEIGVPRYASMRSITANSHFRQDADGSDKQYGFCINGNSDKVYVFEAPIDAMSHATLFEICNKDWRQDSRISLGGVSDLALDKFLENRMDINQITLCLDNDKTGWDNIYGRFNKEKGKQEIRGLIRKYTELGYDVKVSLSNTKDYNSDLLAYLERSLNMDSDKEMEK